MKLGAIINVWADSVCLLWSCIRNIDPVADHIIIVWSQVSNHGVKNDSVLHFMVDSKLNNNPKTTWIQKEPRAVNPQDNERLKRNAGITAAYELGCTHYLMMDTDEFYLPEELLKDKSLFKDNPELNGIVHKLKVFVGKPTLCCDDHTLVPGIQKLMRNSEVGNFKHYPFAYDKQGNAHIDPTRRTNETKGVIMSDHYMWHFSYVRENIDLKIQNSSANLKRSEDRIKRDIQNAAPGYVSELYHRPLEEVPNYFSL